jgi:hypothetical protein
MKLILEYNTFMGEYKPINLYIKGQPSIFIDADKSKEKDILVRSIINEIYPGFKADSSFNFNGVIISGELLNKAQKNIAILYEIVNIAREEGERIQTPDQLINFISTHSQDLFHPEGIFFNRIYTRLGGTTEMGRVKEYESDKLFTRYANTKGVKVELKVPDSYKQDIDGVDSYFEHGGNRYTIQTKTLASIEDKGDHYIVYIDGYFTEIKTHYLVLISKKSFTKKYIFKGKNVTTQIDKNGVNYYYIPKENLLYVED